MASTKSSEDRLKQWIPQSQTISGFSTLCVNNANVTSFMEMKYSNIKTIDENLDNKNVTSQDNVLKISNALGLDLFSNLKVATTLNNSSDNNDTKITVSHAEAVWKHYGTTDITNSILIPASLYDETFEKIENVQVPNTGSINEIENNTIYPFDRRLDRLEQSVSAKNNSSSTFKRFVPFGGEGELSTSSYMASRESVDNAPEGVDKTAMYKSLEENYNRMKSDSFYKGLPSLQNYYAITRLYGSKGGQYLINQKNKRRWYEVDGDEQNLVNYASTPTTSVLISWGRGDPYGRTPYQFTDFVFSKYWNVIPNNRLITLRRYPAPILDNLKFPGMVSAAKTSSADGPSLNDESQTEESGTAKDDSVAFPPMATAITYFGGDSGNNLTSLLKFTTGLPWEDVKAAVWEVNVDNVPDNTSGAGSMYKGIAKLGELLNVANGSFDRDLVQSGGVLPPDPYQDGPYENRIMGPVNRIDSVKKRATGINFEWSGLELVFEYVARPVGGINPKAVLLDILGNFLVMGSASAVFFGGAHRFMAAPARYPFLGGGKGIEQWYKGNPIGWGKSTITEFADKGANIAGAFSGAGDALSKTWDSLINFDMGGVADSISGLFSGSAGGIKDIGSNFVKNYMAGKTAGQVPYLHGMKAILTGEPVGEWHITIGNPLNPIAMIGNLICESVVVEFNEELGPDDFPTEIKLTVKLAHAMARDRDAIESVFNRGMGRIYMLPDGMTGTADNQTQVDSFTKEKTKTGYAPNGRQGLLYTPGMDSRNISAKELQGKPNPLGGEVSVWNRASFNLAVTENSAQQFISSENDLFQTAYRTSNWIAQKALK